MIYAAVIKSYVLKNQVIKSESKYCETKKERYSVLVLKFRTVSQPPLPQVGTFRF